MITEILAGFAWFMGYLKWLIAIATLIAAFRKITSLGPIGWLWAALLIIALDIITPPYIFGSDGIIAAALAPVFVFLGATYIVAFGISLALVYIVAATFIAISFFVI